mmetsp:Transcript_19335/g.23025  ORF Transcript_19335/g.23025 Transcript_19335/m.23025 type:complete len:131 (+) Transcript_19335:48-440(+)
MIHLLSKTRAAAVPLAQRGLLRLQVPSPSTSKWYRSSPFANLSQSSPITTPHVTTTDSETGRALIASHSITGGTEILSETMTDPKSIREFPSRISLRKEDGMHLELKTMIQFTNHRCVCLCARYVRVYEL